MFTLSQENLQNKPFAGKKGFLTPEAHLKKIGTKGDCALMLGQHSNAGYRVGVEEPGIATNMIRKYDGRTGASSAMHGMTQARFNLGCDSGQGKAFLIDKLAKGGSELRKKIGGIEQFFKDKKYIGKDSFMRSDKKKIVKAYNEKFKTLTERAEFLGLKENIESDCDQFQSEGRKGNICPGNPVVTTTGGRRRRRKKSRRKRKKSRRKRKKSRKRRRRR
jgi:hypothetical protein